MKRKILIFLLIILTSLNFIPNVYAAGRGLISFDTGGHSSGGGSTDDTDDTDNKPSVSKESSWEVGSDSYSCKWSYNVSNSNYINVNALDKDGNSLIPDSFDFGDYKLAAGMALKVNINEEKIASYSKLEYELTRQRAAYQTKIKEYACSYSGTYAFYNYYCSTFNNKETVWGDKSCSSHALCTASKIETGRYKTEPHNYPPEAITDTANSEYIKCKKTAEDDADSRIKNMLGNSPSYLVNVTNSNNVNDDIMELPITTSDGRSSHICNNDTKGCSYSKTINYNVNGVCMNLQTGKVTYKNSCDKDSVKIDDYIKSGVNYFHYFIPINTTSDASSVMISITSGKGYTYPASTCISTMEYDSSYMEFMVPLNGNFNGVLANDKLLVKSGCKAAINVKIPIMQDFFREEVKNGKRVLSDHNFYYRKININNPFPHGINNTNSLWKDWYDINYSGNSYNQKSTSKASPNIKNSFSKLSYTSSSRQVENVREVTTPYTDWSDMSLSGYNNNISSELLATRVNPGNILKLGMGPGVCTDNSTGDIVSNCLAGADTCSCIKN